MSGWNKQKLSAFASLQKGISYKSEDYSTHDDGVVFLTIKCVSKSGGFKREGIKFYAGKYRRDDLLQSDDILIANTDLTRDGDIVGCPIRVPDFGDQPTLMSMDLSRVCLDTSGADPSFFYHLLMTHNARKFMREHASGSTVLHLQTSAVPSLEFHVPDTVDEQRRVGEILDTLDQLIEQTEVLISKQQRIKTGLMQNLLTKGIDDNGEIRSEETHEFKDSPLGHIPTQWDTSEIGTLITKFGGTAQTGPFGSQLHAHEYVEDGVPVVMPQDIRSDGSIKTDAIARITPTKAGQLAKHVCHEDDLVFARRGDLTRCAVITVDSQGWLCGTGCLKLVVPTQCILPWWIFYQYKSHHVSYSPQIGQ